MEKDYFNSSLKSIIDLTVAYKEDHITRKEFVEQRALEYMFSCLRAINDTNVTLLSFPSQLWLCINQSNMILMRPKPKFKIIKHESKE